MKLKYIYKIVTIVLTVFASFRVEAYLQSLPPESFRDMYWMAAKGDVSALNAARARGLNIDSVNSNGDTGLCLAARYRNQTAYRSFLRAGANPSHPCTWNISGYENFKLSVMTNNVRNADTARVATYPGKAWSWKTKALIGAGVVAAGAGTAIALAGGGGGGGGHHTSKCVHGHEDSNKNCVCDVGYQGEICNQCASGYEDHGVPGGCYPLLACVHGSQYGGVCLCDAGYGGTLCDECAGGYGWNYEEGKCVPGPAVREVGNPLNANYNYIGNINVVSSDYVNMFGLLCDAGKTYAMSKPAENEFVNAYENTNFNFSSTQSYIIFMMKGGDGDAYGMYSTGAEQIYNTYVCIDEGINAHPNGNISGVISILGMTANNMYGIYGNGDIHNADYKLKLVADESKEEHIAEDTNAKLTGEIQVVNIGKGNAYGIYNNSPEGTIFNKNKSDHDEKDETRTVDEESVQVTINADISAESSVDVAGVWEENVGSGNIYGLYSKGSVENAGSLKVTAGSGKAYGITYGGTLTNNTYYTVTSQSDSYGIYALQGSSESTNAGGVQSSSSVKGNAYGVYMEDSSTLTNTGIIKATAVKGDAYGAYVNNGIFTHSGIVIPYSLVATTEDGNAYGIYATGSSNITNTSNIHATVTSATSSGSAFGIYNVGGNVTHSSTYPAIVVENNGTGHAVGIYSDGGTVTNSGYITVSGTSKDKTYGIYATNGATIVNEGEFVISIGVKQGSEIQWGQIDKWSGCTGTVTESCYAPGGAKAIYIDKTSTLLNAGSIKSAKAMSLSNVVLTTGGSVSAPSLEGEAAVSTDVISSGFNENYVMEKAVVSPDTSALTLHSKSVLFNASLEGEDIVLSKKAFSDVAENKDVAEFLEKNYAAQNNEALFKALKESETVQSFNQKLDDLMGQDLTRFAFEDLTTIKELDFEISEKMLQNKDPVFHLSGTSTPHFFENNNGSKSTWGLSGKNEGNKTFGVGVSFTNISSQDKNNDNGRRDQMFQVFMPVNVHQNRATFSVTPRMGYSYGTYERDGFEGETYDGKIEKRILGLSSSASYKLKKNQFWIAPRAEFNTIGYRLKGHEEDKRFALKLEKQNVLSVEGGVGVQFGYDKEFSKTNRLKINNSLMMYHEFADPYELELSLQGMNGTYRLRDEKRRDERIAIQNGLEFEKGNLSFYANIFSYIDSEYKLKTNAGFKYGF